MKYLYILLITILPVGIFGCSRKELTDGNNMPDKDTCYIIETENGDIELSQELMPYKEFIAEKLKKGSSYAFVRIAGCNEPILLLSDICLCLEINGQKCYVSNEAVAYAVIDNKVRSLGKVQAGVAYSLAIDQLGNMYVAQVEDVRVWNVDLEKQNLVAIEAAYKENGQHKYWNVADNEEIEVDSESYLMSLHERYGEAQSIQFVPLLP